MAESKKDLKKKKKSIEEELADCVNYVKYVEPIDDVYSMYKFRGL